MDELDTFSALKYRTTRGKDGTVRYFDENGYLHREEGPAAVFTDGKEVWYRHGRIHRIGGPAVTLSSGEVFYVINGEQYTREEYEERKTIYL